MNVEARKKIERQIVRCLVQSAIIKGYKVSVMNDSQEGYFVKDSRVVAEVMGQLFQMDEDRVCFTKDGKHAWVWLVYGNDGYDVICDYHLSLEPLIDSDVQPLIDKLEPLCV